MIGRGRKEMELENVKTYEELQDYLLGCMDYATDKQSKANSSFTKEQIWNMYMKDCMSRKGDLPVRTVNLLKKTIKKDFPISEC